MPTFRVYISRQKPNTSISWDFSQTVVAMDATTALSNAYASWAAEKPTPAIPALADCDSKVNEVN